MNVNLLAIPINKAKKEFQFYADALKKGRKEEYLQELKQIYSYLAKGKKIINIYEAFKKIGVNSLDQPKLAVVRADSRIAYFFKRERGAGKFSTSREAGNNWHRHTFDIQLDVELPDHTYSDWITIDVQSSVGVQKRIKEPVLETKVPIIPAKLLPPYDLKNYHIIWEVDKWNVSQAPKDPILAKRVFRNLFAVLAVWDLSPIERALIEGR